MPEEASGQGTLRPSLRGERADCFLEGSGRSSPEGLGLSRRPCTQVLSVAGLLVSFYLFPGWGTVYSEGRKAPFLRAEASPR